MTVIEVEFPRPVAEVFAYLADPANRPEWQSSLRRIEDVDDGPPREGLSWTDVTSAGVRPRMRITRMTPPDDGAAVWAEDGVWRGITASLTLTFRAVGESTVVAAEFEIRGPALLRPVIATLNRLAPYAVRSDLRRAAELLADR